MVLADPGSPLAADIAGNDGWKPLTQAVADYNIDPSFIDHALDAGGEVNCVRKKPNGKNSYQTLNGWLLNGDETHVVTSGHFMYDDEDRKRTSFDDCYIAMNRDVFGSDDDDYLRLKIGSDPTRYRFGGPNPAGNDEGQDRAMLPLVDVAPRRSDGSKRVVPVEANVMAAQLLKVGDDVFMLSSARAFHLKTSKGGFEPMLQRCTVMRVDVSTSGNPDQIRTDCDSHKGVSGSLVFVRDPNARVSLVPVGLQSGAKEMGGLDGRSPDADHNTSIAVLLDSKFFPMTFSGDDLLAETDQSGGSNIASAQ